MAHEMALAQVNSMYSQLAMLVESALAAKKTGGHVDGMEWTQLTMQGFSIITTVLNMVTVANADSGQDLLFVLRNGHFILPE